MFTFQFLNDKIHNYVFFYIIVNFMIQKLKSKHTSLKRYTNWAKRIYFSLVLREREEKNPKYFAPNSTKRIQKHHPGMLYCSPQLQQKWLIRITKQKHWNSILWSRLFSPFLSLSTTTNAWYRFYERLAWGWQGY